jgi:transposase
MARVAADYNLEALQSDKRTGSYTVRELAERHGISKSLVQKLVGHLEPDLAAIVDSNVKAKQQLSELSGQELQSVSTIVDGRTKHLQFFTNATLKNLSMMVKKIDEDTPIADHKIAQEAIYKGKETLMGKTPETAIQINNNVTQPQQLKDLSDDELFRIATTGGN